LPTTTERTAMRKTIAAVTAAGALTAATLLTPPVGYADPIDLNRAICDTYRAEAQGLIIRATARPIATRMLMAAGTSPTWADAFTVIQSAITANCPEYTNLL
jgi:hypothetical protein